MFPTATLNTQYVILVTFLNCTVNRKHVSLQINIASLTYFMKAKGYNCFYADVPLECRLNHVNITQTPRYRFSFSCQNEISILFSVFWGEGAYR